LMVEHENYFALRSENVFVSGSLHLGALRDRSSFARSRRCISICKVGRARWRRTLRALR
jgi:hypothetical protein